MARTFSLRTCICSVCHLKDEKIWLDVILTIVWKEIPRNNPSLYISVFETTAWPNNKLGSRARFSSPYTRLSIIYELGVKYMKLKPEKTERNKSINFAKKLDRKQIKEEKCFLVRILIRQNTHEWKNALHFYIFTIAWMVSSV